MAFPQSVRFKSGRLLAGQRRSLVGYPQLLVREASVTGSIQSDVRVARPHSWEVAAVHVLPKHEIMTVKMRSAGGGTFTESRIVAHPDG